ncbi:hypothetical protein [Candidatus Accumulibacter vicinus]|uniref:Uncharacterized protein n=1 Tax=Candidatus Accumulibacter vicinus TaxID=2954382 RepID=A0A084XWG1_9PROT|nr:hypothetical protein [Candidatus Accumulibacter vicinus]KFB66805.1 MAG: hypothetical protein CAPSK01_003743 [Candidatus Accumulibacter vicinus]
MRLARLARMITFPSPPLIDDFAASKRQRGTYEGMMNRNDRKEMDEQPSVDGDPWKADAFLLPFLKTPYARRTR